MAKPLDRDAFLRRARRHMRYADRAAERGQTKRMRRHISVALTWRDLADSVDEPRESNPIGFGPLIVNPPEEEDMPKAMHRGLEKTAKKKGLKGKRKKAYVYGTMQKRKGKK